MTVVIAAVIAPFSIHAQVGLTVDNKVLLPLGGLSADLDAPGYVVDAGFASQGGNPAIRYEPANARLVMQTRFADLSCDYFDATGQPVVPPSGSFTVEVDRIPTPLGGQDPNVDFSGQPISREFTLDVAAGASIMHMFLAEGPLLDICSSAAACVQPQGVHLRCRQAGTAVFNGDFEAPILSLSGSATSSAATAIAGADGFELEFGIDNTGDLGAPDLVLQIELDALPSGLALLGAALPSQGSFDANTGLWDLGLLEAGTSASLNFAFNATASAPDGVEYCGAISLNSVNGDPLNPAAVDAATCIDVERRIDLVTAALVDPKGTELVDVTNGDVSYSYLFSVRNDGPSNSGGVAMALDLQLPPGVQLDGVVPVNGSYDAQTGIWTVGPVSSGSIGRQIRVDVTVGQGTTPGTDVICAGISVSAANEQRINIFDDQIEECTSVVGPPTIDLVAAIELSNAAPVAGSGSGNFELVHRITNNTAIEATGIQATVAAAVTPAGVDLDSETVAAGTQLTGTLWEIPTLAPGESVEIRRVFTVDPTALSGDQICGSLTGLSANEDLIDIGDDSDAACASIAREVDLVIQVFNTAPTVQPGAAAGTPTYQFQVSNAGPSNASNLDLELSELLPSGVSRGAPSFLVGSFSGSIWSIATMAVGQPAATLTLMYTVDSSAMPGDTIQAALTVQTVAAGETLINTGNDQATAISTIAAP